jgi:hypothetical protein
MIKEEKVIYKKMCRKLIRTNKYLRNNVSLHPINIPDAKIIYKKLPKMIVFKNINTFESELFNFINYFTHSDIKDNPIKERMIYTYRDVQEKIINTSMEYLDVNSILKYYPWLIESPRVMTQLSYRLNDIVAYGYGSFLKQSLESNYDSSFTVGNFDKNYRILFISNYDFSVNTFNQGKIIFSSVFVLGMRRTGKYDLFGVYNGNKRGTSSIIFKDLKEQMGISNISIIIANESYLYIVNKGRGEKYKRAKGQYCFSSIYRRITEDLEINQEESNYVNLILSAKKLSIARSICNDAKNNKSLEPAIFMKLYHILNMPVIDTLYKIEPKYRNRVCTNNIIVYIATIVQILLKDKIFYNDIDTHDFIENASNAILKHGKHFIPNWDELTKKFDK